MKSKIFYKEQHISKHFSLIILLFSFFVITFIIFLPACKDDIPKEIVKEPEENTDKPDKPKPTDTVVVLTKAEVRDYDKLYKPNEFKDMDLLREDSQWSYVRSKQSEHFIVLWEPGFGLNPNSYSLPKELRVDIDDLLLKLENYFDINVNTLGFAELGAGKSNLDQYKMQVYLHYTREWMAFGAGYDDVIGAMWINPSTCQPVGQTIAHELGHSFQYQVYSDLIAHYGVSKEYKRGFRYDSGGSFWEQCAQWQSFQCYPNLPFTTHDFQVYSDNYHRNICHEFQRYASYFIHYYWTDKHGRDFLGKLWRNATHPDDPIEAYMNLNSLSMDEMNAELYEAATRLATWDIDAIRLQGKNYIGKLNYQLYQSSDGSYQVAYNKCPSSTGYNIIPLNVTKVGTVVTTTFTGLRPGSELAKDDPGIYIHDGAEHKKRTYNNSSQSRAGWRYGYVALLKSGERVYGEMNSNAIEEVSFKIPDGCTNLWFVVLGAPSTYVTNIWNESEDSDDQWPYKLSFTNTDLLGNIIINPNDEPKNLTLSYDVSIPLDNDYTGTTFNLNVEDLNEIAKAIVMQPSDIVTNLNAPDEGPVDGKIAFAAVEANDDLVYKTTANGYGFWYNNIGSVVNWGDHSNLFIEFDPNGLEFKIGQYPNKNKVGDNYTLKNALVYTKNGKQYLITLVFNITIS